jgi:hypothetical protein
MGFQDVLEWVNSMVRGNPQSIGVQDTGGDTGINTDIEFLRYCWTRLPDCLPDPDSSILRSPPRRSMSSGTGH